MQVEVLYFARSREVAGTSSETFELTDGATTSELLDNILQRHPVMKDVLGTCVFAVNQQYCGLAEARPLKHQDVVAVIPPLSGG